jgi:hypothetical protein
MTKYQELWKIRERTRDLIGKLNVPSGLATTENVTELADMIDDLAALLQDIASEAGVE